VFIYISQLKVAHFLFSIVENVFALSLSTLQHRFASKAKGKYFLAKNASTKIEVEFIIGMYYEKSRRNLQIFLSALHFNGWRNGSIFKKHFLCTSLVAIDKARARARQMDRASKKSSSVSFTAYS